MRNDLKPACLAAGLAMAWGAAAAAPAASTVTLNASFTPTESVSNAAFVYSSNTSGVADPANTEVSIGYGVVPLGNLVAGTPVSFSFSALDNGNHEDFGSFLFFSDSITYTLFGQNAAGGLSTTGVTAGDTFANTSPTLSESDLLTALADVNAGTNLPAATATLSAALESYDLLGVYGFGEGSRSYSAQFADFPALPDTGISTSTTPFFNITITGDPDPVVPLPSAAFMSLPALATLALRRRRHPSPA